MLSKCRALNFNVYSQNFEIFNLNWSTNAWFHWRHFCRFLVLNSIDKNYYDNFTEIAKFQCKPQLFQLLFGQKCCDKFSLCGSKHMFQNSPLSVSPPDLLHISQHFLDLQEKATILTKRRQSGLFWLQKISFYFNSIHIKINDPTSSHNAFYLLFYLLCEFVFENGCETVIM